MRSPNSFWNMMMARDGSGRCEKRRVSTGDEICSYTWDGEEHVCVSTVIVCWSRSLPPSVEATSLPLDA